MFKIIASPRYAVLYYFLRWTVIIVPIAIAIGTLVALFLWLLNMATQYHFTHPWLLYLLPLAGLVIHFLYKLNGQSAERGNNLIIDEIHEPGAGVPKRMAPLILITTVITHLFGGSAGREGTAVQIGGSLANFVGSKFNLPPQDMRMVLTAGIAAGFGAVFGTPLAGTIFAIEVLTIGRIQYTALLPCLIAGVVGDATVAAWGVQHTAYHIRFITVEETIFGHHLAINFWLLFKVMVASAFFGLAAYTFAQAVHGVKAIAASLIKTDWMIPVSGAIILIILTFILGKPDYLGLGVEPQQPGAVTIVSAFEQGGAHFFSWLWKLIYTAITLGSGFKGGEVTPLFYIGATLGNTLAGLLNAPVSLFAALGFIAVFAGATNTPLACTIMGIELFGSEHALFFAVACFTAYYFSGKTGIYSAQRSPSQTLAGREDFNKKF
ncbi:voltage-gated chloride channel family protein [Mucilaginibacter terrae]|uniref:voltage-gated chloride channel family protein n=1 Tax=Mucilaginibacter terrae TaxID=1955052 RepID=UPI0036436208